MSIIDYEFDKEGVETPLELDAENGVLDVPGGKITTVSGVVYGEQYTMPRNLQLKGTQLDLGCSASLWSQCQGLQHL